MKITDNLVDDILFELIVLSSEVPTNDYVTSVAVIGKLSGFDDEALSHFILAGTEYIKHNKYKGFMTLYSEFLMCNEKDELAAAINLRAQL